LFYLIGIKRKYTSPSTSHNEPATKKTKYVKKETPIEPKLDVIEHGNGIITYFQTYLDNIYLHIEKFYNEQNIETARGYGVTVNLDIANQIKDYLNEHL